MNVIEVVKEIIQLFRSMRSDQKCVINAKEPQSGLEGRPAECDLLKVLHD